MKLSFYKNKAWTPLAFKLKIGNLRFSGRWAQLWLCVLGAWRL